MAITFLIFNVHESYIYHSKCMFKLFPMVQHILHFDDFDFFCHIPTYSNCGMIHVSPEFLKDDAQTLLSTWIERIVHCVFDDKDT